MGEETSVPEPHEDHASTPSPLSPKETRGIIDGLLAEQRASALSDGFNFAVEYVDEDSASYVLTMPGVSDWGESYWATVDDSGNLTIEELAHQAQASKDSSSRAVTQALSEMSDEQLETFWQLYDSKKREVVPMVLLAIFFPIQLFRLDKTGLGIAFLLTVGGLFVWWFIEIFLTPGRVHHYNEELAVQIALDVRLLGE